MKTATPLVPGNVDLRDFPFMPLDVRRLRDCDLTACTTGDEFKAAVLLWCASWHQQPAASLPDDDRILARLVGHPIDEWKAMRDPALHGWLKCSDGRLYHPVVAEKANEAWAEKQRYRDRTAAARAAKAKKYGNSEQGSPPQKSVTKAVTMSVTEPVIASVTKTVTEPVAVSVTDPVTTLIGTGTGTGTGTGIEEPLTINIPLVANNCARGLNLAASTHAHFEKFYENFPRKRNKLAAESRFKAAIRSGVPPDQIVDGAKRYATACARARLDMQFVKVPDTWLAKGCWSDEDLPRPIGHANGMAAAVRRFLEEDDHGQSSQVSPGRDVQLFQHLRQ
jgi:Protein of unknown function (DUF1376)